MALHKNSPKLQRLKLIHYLARSRSSCCLQKHIELEGIKGCLGSKCHFWSIPSSPLLLTINHIQSLYWSLLINISYYYITAICHGSGGALAGANSSAAAARPLCRISLEHRVPWKNFNIFQQPVQIPSDPFSPLLSACQIASDCASDFSWIQSAECWHVSCKGHT